MNSPSFAELVLPPQDSPQRALALVTEHVQRYVWDSRFGPMLIEVIDGIVYVNGERVDRVADAGPTERSASPPGVHP